ncbi:MAG: FliA/WhiG family RNA polymerase sigma factor [Bacillota bacterium]|nr:FliA/WhiG family RNA polymerase sigma factor [Bacillota bacterium]
MSAVMPERNAHADVWQAYKSRHDLRARDSLIVRYAPLVKYVAGRLAMGLPSHIEVDDLVSYGVFGLIEAIERYDPDRQVKFETYAIARIRGAMLDSLRAFDWIPYSVRQKARELEAAYAKVEARLGRSATDAEVASELGVPVERLHKMLRDVQGMALVSLDEVLSGEDESGNQVRTMEVIGDASAQDPLSYVEFEDRKRILAEAIERLPEKERLVIALYYHQGLTVTEISRILGVSQSRISQVHSRAVMRLRSRLAHRLSA